MTAPQTQDPFQYELMAAALAYLKERADEQPGLDEVADAIGLSRAMVRNIRQNLGWAFGYNVALIPVATGVFAPLGLTLSPMLAGAAMAASSVCVVLNALRLKTVSLEGRT